MKGHRLIIADIFVDFFGDGSRIELAEKGTKGVYAWVFFCSVIRCFVANKKYVTQKIGAVGIGAGGAFLCEMPESMEKECRIL